MPGPGRRSLRDFQGDSERLFGRRVRGGLDQIGPGSGTSAGTRLYRSRKSDEIEANPRGALLFYWDPPGRQVRIEGPLGRISPEESDGYFATRARGSQIAAHASMQSHLIESRDALDARVLEEASRFESSAIPRPSGWGGFRLVPETMEFWQQRHDRLHDRLLYSRGPQGWRVERLQP